MMDMDVYGGYPSRVSIFWARSRSRARVCWVGVRFRVRDRVRVEDRVTVRVR